jgi:hypothetical protein
MKQKASDIIFKILLLIITAILGWIMMAFTPNILLILGLFPENAQEIGFGPSLISKSILVWAISMILCILLVFLKPQAKFIAYSLPIIAPSIFAFIYALTAA